MCATMRQKVPCRAELLDKVAHSVTVWHKELGTKADQKCSLPDSEEPPGFFSGILCRKKRRAQRWIADIRKHTQILLFAQIQKPDRAYREKTAAGHVPGSLSNRYRPDICFGTKVAIYIGICGRIKNLSKVQRQGRSGLNNEHNSNHCSCVPV